MFGNWRRFFGFDVLLGVIHRAGAALHCYHFAVQILDAFHAVVVSVDHHQQAAFVVAIGEVDCFFAFVGNGDTGQRQIRRSWFAAQE